MARPNLEPVSRTTLPEFAAFLQRYLDQSRSAEQWAAGLTTDWMPDQPNHGFVLRDNGQIVGGIGAYYADRLIAGKAERVCNITSWCVLDAYRPQSMRLAMAVVAQKGFHFTDFSPTKIVAATLQFLKFKPLDERRVVALNLPWADIGGWRVISNSQCIDETLTGSALKAFRDHRQYPWLQHLLIGRGKAWCHVIYKRRLFKGLPSADILYASDRTLLSAGWRHLASHLLLRGLVSTHVEFRVLGRQPWPSVLQSGFNPKLYLSSTLLDELVDYLYSETMALDL